MSLMEIISESADWVRLVNIILCATYLVILGWRWRHLAGSTTASMYRTLALALMVLVCLIGSIETLIDDSPAPGIRSYLWTVALTWALLSLRPRP